MALVRWRPFTSITRLAEEIEDWFERFLPSRRTTPAFPWWMASSEWYPAVDVYEKGDDLVVKVDLPGVNREDINVNVTDQYVTISAEARREDFYDRGGVYREERYYGSISRVIPLPLPVQPEKARARFRNGVLEITLPKALEARGVRVKIS